MMHWNLFIYLLHRHLCQHHLLKKFYFLHWIVLALLSKIQCPYIIGLYLYSLVLSSELFVCLHVNIIQSWLPYLYKKSWSQVLLILVWFVFTRLFGFSRSFSLPYKFWNQFVNFYERFAGILMKPISLITCWSYINFTKYLWPWNYSYHFIDEETNTHTGYRISGIK